MLPAAILTQVWPQARLSALMMTVCRRPPIHLFVYEALGLATPWSDSRKGAPFAIFLLPTPRGIVTAKSFRISIGASCPRRRNMDRQSLLGRIAEVDPTKTGTNDTRAEPSKPSYSCATVSPAPCIINSGLRSLFNDPLILHRHQRDQDTLGPGAPRQLHSYSLRLGGHGVDRLEALLSTRAWPPMVRTNRLANLPSASLLLVVVCLRRLRARHLRRGRIHRRCWRHCGPRGGRYDFGLAGARGEARHDLWLRAGHDHLKQSGGTVLGRVPSRLTRRGLRGR